ncbi:MAG: TetR/AcrR family transcriptional regulator, partial [Pseudonocardia sp.]
LGLALESLSPARARTVRVAELVLTLLHGAAGLAEDAPGFGDPFDLVHAAEHLAGVAVVDDAVPPHLPHVAPARPVADPWDAPRGLRDEISGRAIDLGRDGVVVALGVQRLSSAEEAVRAARVRDDVTVVLVTDDPDETGRLARLRVVDLVGCLRRVFRPGDLPRIRVVLDDRTLAQALGLDEVDDHTEIAIRVRGGTVVARAEGYGAGHAAAAATAF